MLQCLSLSDHVVLRRAYGGGTVINTTFRDMAILTASGVALGITLGLLVRGVSKSLSSELPESDGERIAAVSDRPGLYAVHDQENGMLCYVAVGDNKLGVTCSPYYYGDDAGTPATEGTYLSNADVTVAVEDCQKSRGLPEIMRHQKRPIEVLCWTNAPE